MWKRLFVGMGVKLNLSENQNGKQSGKNNRETDPLFLNEK